MIVNAFTGREAAPADSDLASALGPAKTLWDGLVASLTSGFALTAEWGSSSKKAGWSLRMKRGARNVVYLIPGKNTFGASFALGDRAVQAALKSRLPDSVVQAIRTAPKYAEGTGVRLEVNGPEEVEGVRILVGIKLEH